MKKRLTKGILAAALAFASILSVPQITANAACNHNYRHYAYDSSDWRWSGITTREENGRSIHYAVYKKTVYTCCVNCGKDKGSYTTYKYVCIE